MAAVQVGGPQPCGARQGRIKQRYGSNNERLVAGCIPVRVTGDGSRPEDVQVLLVSSRGIGTDGLSKSLDGKGHCFPKGGWEDDESLQAAARRETVEEAGVRGCLVEPMLGAFPFTSCKPSAPTSRNQGKCIAHMFLMHVAEELEVWPEGHERQRHWVTLAGAHAHCRYDWMAEALCTFMADLEGWTARLREQAAAQAAQQQHACAGARATPPTAAGAGPGASAGAAAAEPAGAEATTGCDAEQQERVSM